MNQNKAKRLSGINPLAYMGVEPITPALFVTDNRAPTARDIDSFNLGTIWLNTDTEIPYMLTNMDAGVATWTMLAPGGTGANTFNTNVTGPVNDLLGVLNVLGDTTTITTTGTAPNTITISMVANPVIPGVITTTTREVNAAVPMVVDHRYINTNVGLTSFLLPAVAPLGSMIKITGESAGLWRITQNAGQQIQFGDVVTTAGIAGYIEASKANDSVTISCRVANTTWQVEAFTGGAFTVA